MLHYKLLLKINVKRFAESVGQFLQQPKHCGFPESTTQLTQAHKVHEAIKLLNKTNKAETRTRIKTFFYKISDSDLYKEFLLAGVDENACTYKTYIEHKA